MSAFLSEYKWYCIFFMIGLLCAAPYSTEQIHQALEIVGVLMLVALFASLLVPFQAFSLPERHKKWALQNSPLIGFGTYAMAVIHDPTLIKIVVMISAMTMHISYWTSGIHSRGYRHDQFMKGFGHDLIKTSQLIACLNGIGRSELGDTIVVAVLQQQKLTANFWSQLPGEYAALSELAQAELNEKP